MLCGGTASVAIPILIPILIPIPTPLPVPQCCRRTLRKQLDHNLTFHKLVAYTLALLTGTAPRGLGHGGEREVTMG